MPALVLLLVLFLGVVTVGMTQLRLEEAARAGAREIMRGETDSGVRAAVRQIAGEDAQLEVSGEGNWSTVTVSATVRGPLVDFVDWQLFATASARTEAMGPIDEPLSAFTDLTGDR